MVEAKNSGGDGRFEGIVSKWEVESLWQSENEADLQQIAA